MKRIVFWIMYWIFIAFALFAALDNLFFQPPMPGMIIGIVALCSIVLVLFQTKRSINRRIR